jgi:hypothetical protein
MLNSFLIARRWIIVNAILASLVSWRVEMLRLTSPPGLCDFGCSLELTFIILPLLIAALFINAFWLFYYFWSNQILNRRRFIYTYSSVLGIWFAVLMFNYARFNNYL